MNQKEKSDATQTQRSSSWKNYYEVPKQMFNQVRNYIPSSIADYWSGSFGFGSNTIGTCYFQPPKKSKGNMEKTAENSQPYVVDSNTYSMYNQYVYDITTRSQQPVNVVQNKESFLFDSSIPPPCSSKPLATPPQPTNPQQTTDHSRQNQSCSRKFFGANSFLMPKAPGGDYLKCSAAPSETWWAGGQPLGGAGRQQQMNYPFPTQQWQLGNMSSMTSVADNMLWDTATDILVQYVCQETEPNQFDSSSVKSNLNPDAEEFIPNHLVDHFHKNQNSEYLNKAMLETAIKSSMEDVRAYKTFHSPYQSCEEVFGDKDNTDSKTLKEISTVSDEKDISAYKKSASQPHTCDKVCVVPNQLISASIQLKNYDLPFDASKSFPMKNKDSIILKELFFSNVGDKNCHEVKLKPAVQEDVGKMNEDESLQNCDKKETLCTSGHCNEETQPIVQHKMQVNAINGDFSTKSLRGHKDDISNTSMEDDFTLEDLLDSKFCLSSSSCDSDGSLSDHSKSVSRNLSESSDDSLIQFYNSSQEILPGIPKLLRLDSTEVNVASDEVSDESSDVHDEDDEETDWDEVSCDGQDQVDNSYLMDLFSTGLCLTNLRPTPVSTQCFSLPCLTTTSPTHCFLPDPANFNPIGPCMARVNSICLVSPTTFAFEIPQVRNLNRVGIEKDNCGKKDFGDVDLEFGAGSVHDPGFGAGRVEDPGFGAGSDVDPLFDASSVADPVFGANRSEDLDRVNNDWKSVPDKSRLSSPVVQFSCSPVTIILEPDNLADDLKQARISDFPRRQADKERMERLLSPILTNKHRQNIYQKLYLSNNNDNKTLGLTNSSESLNS